MASIAEQLGDLSRLTQVTVPDLWQQEAVAALRDGQDVVVQAPTGAGKTLIFELWSKQGKNPGQAIYTVPTRALANDKLAEWRARGWDVGIATGDLSDNLEAPILVATLETQKNRLIHGDGPKMLVVDEYQMLGDPDRGLNYELALALAPPATQLLLLSGSVANPHHVVKWLERLGRRAVLIRHDERPVPMDEVVANQLSYQVPTGVRGYWPRVVAKALADDLGPILIFSPQRQGAEKLAGELARQLPNPHPLQLSPEQKQLVGEDLVKLLKCRVAYHHSGLSYGARAGVIEPLAKAGQLRVVVATMGLAAGINFSLRSVALAGDSYRRDHQEYPLRADEILQMFGRAGRRGIDEMGFVLVVANQIRLREGHPCHLARNGMVDWGALLGLMSGAAELNRDPYKEAIRAQQRLFTTKPIFLGVEESLTHPDVPCGLKTDAERARHVRKRVKQMLNSRGEWERFPKLQERPLGDVRATVRNAAGKADTPQFNSSESGREEGALQPAFRPALSEPAALEKVGPGQLIVVEEADSGPIYGREFTVADLLNEDRVLLVKWIRRLTRWQGRQAKLEVWNEKIAPLLAEKLAEQNMPVLGFEQRQHKLIVKISLANMPIRVPVDSHGIPLWRPIEREVLQPDCAVCTRVPACRKLSTATGVALLWRRLGLIDAQGVPTLRGQVVSYFSQGDGLAVAAALEDPSYPLDELIYDLANLDAGFRFCHEEDRWGGRLAVACHEVFGWHSIPGYLENGVPPKYGSGAEQVVAAAHKNPASKHTWAGEMLGPGDIDRVIIEWRSLLRQIAHAPALEWERWQQLQTMAREILNETESPTVTDLPPLQYDQTKRIDHRLVLRRH